MIDVLIITRNEALNLPHCLASLEGWTQGVFVIDSGSTDDTVKIAREAGVHVVHHDWPGYAKQRNWALDHLPLTAPWTLILDADESIPDALRDRLTDIASRPSESVPENGYFVNRLSYYLGRPLRHGGYFPSWNLRFFKRGRARYEDRQVHEHMVIDEPVGYIHEPIDHHDRRGVKHFYDKHARYAQLEAEALAQEILAGPEAQDDANLTRASRRRRWLKRHVMRRLPWPGAWRFAYMYIYKRGFLDGSAGYHFCRLIAHYDAQVARHLRRRLAED